MSNTSLLRRWLTQPQLHNSLRSRGRRTLFFSSKIHNHSDEKTLHYSQKEIYTVIADVDSYGQFVPFCTASKVHSAVAGSQRVPVDGVNKPWVKENDTTYKEFQLTAELKVGYMSFEESYTSTVDCRQWEMVKATSNNASLFNHLSTTWTLRPHPKFPNRTIVGFTLAYAFASPLYSSVSALFFDKISSQMVNAFQGRCEKIYGRRS